MVRKHVFICGGTNCSGGGGQKVRDRLEDELARQGLGGEIKVVQTGCFGLCANGPMLLVHPDGTIYNRVSPDDVPEIVTQHLLMGHLVQR
ncbi:MAG: (2Fe-2S) ferredoxin domain-containing protein, partial [Firmicutes bacterium]|nr:(2Fe-2S) ferredoxin domain-containing protein [Bacillota bacterium]